MTAKTLASLGRCALAALTLAVPALAQNAPQARSPMPRQVQITVHQIRATTDQYAAASRTIKPGQKHDAQLLAALLKGTAKDIKVPLITTSDDVRAYVSLQRQAAPSVPNWQLATRAEIEPHVKQDGSIIALVKLDQEELAPGVIPPATPTDFPPAKTIQGGQADFTFKDGQTLVVGDMKSTDAKTNVETRSLVFATVKIVASPPSNPAPL